MRHVLQQTCVHLAAPTNSAITLMNPLNPTILLLLSLYQIGPYELIPGGPSIHPKDSIQATEAAPIILQLLEDPVRTMKVK